jgi:hypothetical protein
MRLALLEGFDPHGRALQPGVRPISLKFSLCVNARVAQLFEHLSECVRLAL